MATLSDADAIDVIHSLWPDFPVTKEELISVKPEFVIEFSQRFINSWKDTLLHLLHEEETGDELATIPNFGTEVNLYYNTCKVFAEITNADLHLGDFFNGDSRKMSTVIKCCLHFLSYLQNSLEEISLNVGNNCKLQDDKENLKSVKEYELQKSGENAEKLGRLADVHKLLEIELENIRLRYEELMINKAIEEKSYQEKQTELANLNRQIDNSEYELKLLDDQERKLQEDVVTQEDYDNLQHILGCLKKEAEDLGNVDFDHYDENHEEIILTNQLEECPKELGDLRFNVETTHDLRLQVQSNENCIAKLTAELTSQNYAILDKENSIKELEQKSKKDNKLSNEYQSHVAENLEKQEKSFQRKVVQNTADFEELQVRETYIMQAEEEIGEIESGERLLNAAVARQYKKILIEEKNTTVHFHKVLSTLRGKKK